MLKFSCIFSYFRKIVGAQIDSTEHRTILTKRAASSLSRYHLKKMEK